MLETARRPRRRAEGAERGSPHPLAGALQRFVPPSRYSLSVAASFPPPHARPFAPSATRPRGCLCPAAPLSRAKSQESRRLFFRSPG
eukprot:scaffold37410_cov32-Tisochrysis_lutea.AAC.1